MSFNTDSLESMCELIVDCPHSTPEWTDSGVIVLRNQNIKNGNLDLSSPSYTTQKDFEGRIKRAAPTEGDIVLTREAPMGEVCRIPKGIKCCLGQRQVLLRPKKEVDGDYLFWALQSPFVQNQIAWSEGTGSTVSNLRIPLIKALKIPRFHGSEKNIGKTLNGLWKKIHLNTQTNQTLESIAQAIFKSWFVDFEPVKAKMAVLAEGGTREQAELAAMGAISGKGETELAQLQQQNPEHYQQLAETAALFPSAMVESELGEIPEGWEVSEIGNEVDIVGGGTPSTTEPSFWEDGEIHWTTPKDLSNNKSKVLLNTERKITEAGLAKISSGLLPVNTVLMSSRAPVGYLALAKIPVAVNQGYIAMKCNSELSPEFIILWAESVMDEIQQRASGTTFAEISKKTFRSIPLIKPNKGAINKFTEKVHTIFNQIASHETQTQTLIQLRDSLLPRLLSGEITVDTE